MDPLPAHCHIERVVEWVDTDAAGHQHNSAIMRWVESCEAQLMRERGIREYFPSAPRVQQTIAFTAKLYFGQRVSINVTIESLGVSSLTLAFEVFGEEFDGHPRVEAARGTVTTVHVPRGMTRSAPWPDIIRSRLGF